MFTSLASSLGTDNYTVIREKNFEFNGNARIALSVLKNKSGRIHEVVQYENGMFSSAVCSPR